MVWDHEHKLRKVDDTCKDVFVGIKRQDGRLGGGGKLPTAHRPFHYMRCAMLENMGGDGQKIRGRLEVDEPYFGGKRKGNRGSGAAGKVIVFGIREKRGRGNGAGGEERQGQDAHEKHIKKGQARQHRVH